MGTVSSSASSIVGVTPQPPSWWLKCPTSPALNMALNVTSWQPVAIRTNARYLPVGRTRTVVLRGPALGDEGTLGCRTLSPAQYTALKALLDSQQTLLLQNTLGQQWYVEVAAGESRAQQRAAKEGTETTPTRNYYEWTVPCVEVDIP